MASIHGFTFGAFVVEAAFLDGKATFALGDGSVRMFDGTSTKEFGVHKGAILAAAATREGGLLTGGDDGVVALTVGKGMAVPLAERPGTWIDVVAAGPSETIAFAIGKQATVRFADGREKAFDQPRAIAGLAFAPKGLRLALASVDGVTLRFPNTDGAPTELKWAGAHLLVSFSPDGKYLMTAMQENSLHGWRLEDGQDLRMSGYAAKPKSLSWSAKGRWLASSGANAAILWPFLSKEGPVNKRPMELGARDTLVTRVACHPKDEVAAIGYRDGMIVLAQFADRREARLRQGGDGPISALTFDAATNRLAFGTEEGAAGVIDLDAA